MCCAIIKSYQSARIPAFREDNGKFIEVAVLLIIPEKTDRVFTKSSLFVVAKCGSFAKQSTKTKLIIKHSSVSNIYLQYVAVSSRNLHPIST